MKYKARTSNEENRILLEILEVVVRVIIVIEKGYSLEKIEWGILSY